MLEKRILSPPVHMRDGLLCIAFCIASLSVCLYGCEDIIMLPIGNNFFDCIWERPRELLDLWISFMSFGSIHVIWFITKWLLYQAVGPRLRPKAWKDFRRTPGDTWYLNYSHLPKVHVSTCMSSLGQLHVQWHVHSMCKDSVIYMTSTFIRSDIIPSYVQSITFS